MSNSITNYLNGYEVHDLHYEGRLPDPDKPSVAIIGARFCSEYGRYMARVYGHALAEEGFQIITDMSLGVGGIAAKAALDAGGEVYAVLGTGVDVCYPPEHRDLYDRIKKSGGVLSEYEDGTVPKPDQFRERNKIIAEFADAVIVVEARKKTGTLVTVDFAKEMGKAIYAIPGRATDRLSDGTNLLIKEGARMTLKPEDFIQQFQYQ